MATGSPQTEAQARKRAARANPMTTGVGAPAVERPSLRKRLATAFAVLALLIALAQAGFVWLVGERAEEQLIDRILAEQLHRSIAMHWQRPGFAAPNTPDMSLYLLADGDSSAEAALPGWLRSLPRRTGSYEVHPGEGLEYHVAIERDRDTWFFLVYDVADHEARQRDTLALLAVSVFVIAGLALLVSGRLARRLTGDLQRLAEAVSAPGDPARNGEILDSMASHAETARLAGALDAYRMRLRDALDRERAFTAAANHELRTPLMRAGSSLDLLRAGLLDERQRKLVDTVQSSIDEMAMLTGALLRVARGRNAEAARETDLASLVAEVLAHLAAEAQARGVALHAEVPSALHRQIDRSALWIVLANLVRNAIRHSGGRCVRVGWCEDSLQVDDDGVGLEAAATPAVEPGLGIGLVIVERICEAAGWRLELASRHEGGTRATVGIPAG